MIGRVVLSLGVAGAALMALAGPASAVTVNLFCSSSGIELQLCREGADAWAKQTGNEVTITTLPSNWDEALPMYQQLLAVGSTDIDVLILDNVWIGPLKNHLLNLDGPIDRATIDAHFKVALDSVTVDGQVLAMPQYIDVGFLFYRKDLLEQYGAAVPQTWQELTETAQRIQDAERAAGNANLWGYVFQGRAYEGLTCNLLEWFGSAGGSVIAPDGTITADSEANRTMLTLAAGWIGTISPEGVLNYDEEGSRGVFQNGDAIFMRNWSYAWQLAQSDDSAIKDKVGVTALPAGGPDGRHAGTYGAALLGISKYTTHPAEAVDLVRYLTSADEQKRRSIVGSYNPSIIALYDDPEVLAATPFLGYAKEAFADAIDRPTQVTASEYPRVSSEVWNAVHNALDGSVDPAAALSELAASLESLKARGGW